LYADINEPCEVYRIKFKSNPSNSIKFTSSGYIAVTVSFEGNHLVFSVKDTGIGINKKLSEAIFEPFVQADTSLTRKHQGYSFM
jgi:signal transduction histidine kinase